MNQDTIHVRVSRLDATAPAGVPLVWQGREFDSGPLTIELDNNVGGNSGGQLDYAAGRAEATFHVALGFPAFAAALGDLGVDPALTQPVRATVRSSGAIASDHSFSLAGGVDWDGHALFPPETATASVLPGA